MSEACSSSNPEEKVSNPKYLEKQAIRKRIRNELKTLSSNEISSQSNQVWDQLYQTSQYQNSKSIGVFLSMPKGEIHTDPLLHRLIEDQKQIYVPRVGKNFQEADMNMYRVVQESGHKQELFHKSWSKNKWGIPEPVEDVDLIAKPGSLDLLVVPGVAFDSNGGRLGQGKGYYDRFIQKMNHVQDQQKMHLIGVGLEPQFLKDEIPMMEHDIPLDLVISPTFIWGRKM